MAGLLQYHRRVVRGEGAGVMPALVRATLRAASLPYQAAVRSRNFGYDVGLLASHAAPVPVVSVGNLTAGGVGKTPLVETIVRWLEHAGRSPVIVSRGFGGQAGTNDEALLLKENLPGTPHVQNPDRVTAVHEVATRRLGDVVVLDDGFQHRRLKRAVDLVLLDATDPFGGGRLLPRGFLREPISSLRRATAIVLTRAGLVPASERAAIRDCALAAAPSAAWAAVDFEPSGWGRFGTPPAPLAALRDMRVFAFCGIGNPEAFRRTLAQLNVTVSGMEPFPDHHWYGDDDCALVARRARAVGARALVATQKDAVKIPKASLEEFPLYVLRIATRFLEGEEAVRQLILDGVSGAGGR